MIKAVLLDLDDTLLLDNGFVPAYLKTAELYFREQHHIDSMDKHLIGVLKALGKPHDLRLSNTAVALDYLKGATGSDGLTSAFDAFYADVYPRLQSVTTPVGSASTVIDTAKRQNLPVIIATNPVYPATAIQQRLDWAGLSAYLDDFAFVTTGDDMHFIKPDPAYYAEVIARVGVEPDEALMVGNDPINDIQPARQVGLATYHVSGSSQPDAGATAGGNLTHLATKLAAARCQQSVRPAKLQPASIEPQLRGNLGALFGLLSLVEPHQWAQRPDPREWSILQVVRHLYEREASVQRRRLETILEQDNPFLSPPPLPSPAEGEMHEGMELAQQFVREREKTLKLIGQIPDGDWLRPAQHSTFGQTNLLEMAHFTAQHDRIHITQICQTLKRCR